MYSRVKYSDYIRIDDDFTVEVVETELEDANNSRPAENVAPEVTDFDVESLSPLSAPEEQHFDAQIEDTNSSEGAEAVGTDVEDALLPVTNFINKPPPPVSAPAGRHFDGQIVNIYSSGEPAEEHANYYIHPENVCLDVTDFNTKPFPPLSAPDERHFDEDINFSGEHETTNFQTERLSQHFAVKYEVPENDSISTVSAYEEQNFEDDYDFKDSIITIEHALEEKPSISGVNQEETSRLMHLPMIEVKKEVDNANKNKAGRPRGAQKRKFKCPNCDFHTDKQEILAVHIFQSKPEKCPLCSFETGCAPAISKHFRLCHRDVYHRHSLRLKEKHEKPKECTYCSYKCVSTARFADHLTPSECPKCGMKCPCRTIKQHDCNHHRTTLKEINLHHNYALSYDFYNPKCHKCGYTTHKPEVMFKHKQIHHPTVRCPDCSYKCPRELFSQHNDSCIIRERYNEKSKAKQDSDVPQNKVKTGNDNVYLPVLDAFANQSQNKIDEDVLLQIQDFLASTGLDWEMFSQKGLEVKIQLDCNKPRNYRLPQSVSPSFVSLGLDGVSGKKAFEIVSTKSPDKKKKKSEVAADGDKSAKKKNKSEAVNKSAETKKNNNNNIPLSLKKCYKCTVCENSFEDFQECLKHRSMCKKTTEDSGNDVPQSLETEPELYYVCMGCNRKFSNRRECILHNFACDSPPERNIALAVQRWFTCRVCDAGFSDLQKCLVHTMTCEQLRNEALDKTTISEANKSENKDTVTDKNPVEMQQLNESFTQGSIEVKKDVNEEAVTDKILGETQQLNERASGMEQLQEKSENRRSLDISDECLPETSATDKIHPLNEDNISNSRSTSTAQVQEQTSDKEIQEKLEGHSPLEGLLEKIPATDPIQQLNKGAASDKEVPENHSPPDKMQELNEGAGDKEIQETIENQSSLDIPDSCPPETDKIQQLHQEAARAGQIRENLESHTSLGVPETNEAKKAESEDKRIVIHSDVTLPLEQRLNVNNLFKDFESDDDYDNNFQLDSIIDRISTISLPDQVQVEKHGETSIKILSDQNERSSAISKETENVNSVILFGILSDTKSKKKNKKIEAPITENRTPTRMTKYRLIKEMVQNEKKVVKLPEKEEVSAATVAELPEQAAVNVAMQNCTKFGRKRKFPSYDDMYFQMPIKLTKPALPKSTTGGTKITKKVINRRKPRKPPLTVKKYQKRNRSAEIEKRDTAVNLCDIINLASETEEKSQFDDSVQNELTHENSVVIQADSCDFVYYKL